MSYWGISARNNAQKEALKALANDKPYVFLTGPAGTGKTLVSLAVGLHDVVERQKYRGLIYTRLQTQLGVDLGALPGDIGEKTYPFIAPFLDNFELLAGKDSLAYLVMGDEKKRKVFFDPIQTMRGRSLHHKYVMVDEAQNLDWFTSEAIATRPGVQPDGSLSSKIIFIGNFAQTDVAKLRNPDNNGMYRLMQGLYEKEAHDYFDHIHFEEGQRHPAVDLVESIFRNKTIDKRFIEMEMRGSKAEYADDAD